MRRNDDRDQGDRTENAGQKQIDRRLSEAKLNLPAELHPDRPGSIRLPYFQHGPVAPHPSPAIAVTGAALYHDLLGFNDGIRAAASEMKPDIMRLTQPEPAPLGYQPPHGSGTGGLAVSGFRFKGKHLEFNG